MVADQISTIIIKIRLGSEAVATVKYPYVLEIIRYSCCVVVATWFLGNTLSKQHSHFKGVKHSVNMLIFDISDCSPNIC